MQTRASSLLNLKRQPNKATTDVGWRADDAVQMGTSHLHDRQQHMSQQYMSNQQKSRNQNKLNERHQARHLLDLHYVEQQHVDSSFPLQQQQQQQQQQHHHYHYRYPPKHDGQQDYQQLQVQHQHARINQPQKQETLHLTTIDMTKYFTPPNVPVSDAYRRKSNHRSSQPVTPSSNIESFVQPPVPMASALVKFQSPEAQAQASNARQEYLRSSNALPLLVQQIGNNGRAFTAPASSPR